MATHGRGEAPPRPYYDKRKWLLGKIHSMAKRRGLADAERYRLQRDLTGVESCADMSERQLVQVLQALQGDQGREASGMRSSPLSPIGDIIDKTYLLRRGGPVCPPDSDGPSRRMAPTKIRTGRDERQPDEPITREQLAKIEHLRSHVRLYSSEAWMSFCRRVIKHPWPQSRAEGNHIIEALKSMDARGWQAREGAR